MFHEPSLLALAVVDCPAKVIFTSALASAVPQILAPVFLLEDHAVGEECGGLDFCGGE